MNEYKMIVTVYDDGGMFPDFFGTTREFYETANSAKELQEKFEQEMKTHASGVRYKLSIEKF